MTLAALLLGTNDSGDDSGNNTGVGGCTLSAVRMAAMLRETFGYSSDKIILMCDDNYHKSIPPTRNNVELAMMNLVQWSVEAERLGEPATLWLYGCFGADLGADGIFSLQGDATDPVLTRDQFWRFLTMLPSSTRVICLVDAKSCRGIKCEGIFRYSGRRTQCLGRPIAPNSSVPDVIFIFSEPSSLAEDDKEDELDEQDERDEQLEHGVDGMLENRLTGIFIAAMTEYNRRLSVTTLLRKMAAISRKSKRDFVPVIESTRPLDPVRPFSADISDRPLMVIVASGSNTSSSSGGSSGGGSG